MSPKKISVMIAVLNGGENLRKCLSSVCAQDTEVYEYVIVDNNSTDNTKAIIEEFQRTHANMRYVFEETRSRGAARNAGVVNVSGDIIVMTDVDCIVPNNWVQKLVHPIVFNREKMVCGGQYDLVGNYWSTHMQKMGDYYMKTAVSPDGYVVFCDTKNFAIDAVLMKSMMFDARFTSLENVEFDYRMRTVAPVKYLADVKVGHRNVGSAIAVFKLFYSRAYWMAQIYHKFKGIRDRNGIFIFPVIPMSNFYLGLFKINFTALREQGFMHLLFFLVSDSGWKLGSIIGFARVDKKLRLNKSSMTNFNF